MVLELPIAFVAEPNGTLVPRISAPLAALVARTVGSPVAQDISNVSPPASSTNCGEEVPLATVVKR